MAAYADNENGVIPPFSSGVGDDKWRYGVTGWWYGSHPYYHPWVTYQVNYAAGRQYPLNLGKIYTDGYLGNVRALYCPAGKYADFMLATLLPRWSDPFGLSIRTGYNYNPNVKNTSVAGHGPDWGDLPAYTRLEDFPEKAPLTTDLITLWRPVDVAHQSGTPAWNLLYADGHVACRLSRAAFDYALSTVRASDGALNTGDNWEQLRTLLDKMQE
ncbi:MAG: hypothetical protein BWZ02_00334 [Lentisphaerae bacterium ADurb.BinA184]|nr:MAG: hypothetical protein BWZ02_00334 [Lentisphaerae bacterium ADurb.BinA184]